MIRHSQPPKLIALFRSVVEEAFAIFTSGEVENGVFSTNNNAINTTESQKILIESLENEMIQIGINLCFDSVL